MDRREQTLEREANIGEKIFGEGEADKVDKEGTRDGAIVPPYSHSPW